MLNTELILKRLKKSNDPSLDALSLSSDPDGLIEFEIVALGNELLDKDGDLQVGDVILTRRDIPQEIKHDDFTELYILFSPKQIAFKCLNK